MGRKERRINEKKNRDIIKEMEEELDVSIKFSTLIKIIVVIVLLLFVLYYILAVFVTKEVDVSGDKGASTSASTESVENSILASNIFNQVEGTYYVYFYDFDNEDKNISTAISNVSDITIYRVNTKSAFNSKYVTDGNGNSGVTSIDNLKVKDPTLMEITNDKVTKYVEGTSNIVSFLSR